jgi:hypothetical protein
MIFLGILAWIVIGHFYWIKHTYADLRFLVWPSKTFIVFWELLVMPLYWLMGPVVAAVPQVIRLRPASYDWHWGFQHDYD